MGFEHHKRPILARGGVLASTGSTMTGSDVFGGVGIQGPFRLPVESITLSSAAQTLSVDGVSFLTYGTSGKPNDAIIPNPQFSGQVKYIFLQNNTTSVEANINTAATANTFWGTTANTVTVAAASTGSPGGTPAGTAALCLIAASTTQWALYPGSTFNWDIAGSTGSTATA